MQQKAPATQHHPNTKTHKHNKQMANQHTQKQQQQNPTGKPQTNTHTQKKASPHKGNEQPTNKKHKITTATQRHPKIKPQKDE